MCWGSLVAQWMSSIAPLPPRLKDPVLPPHMCGICMSYPHCETVRLLGVCKLTILCVPYERQASRWGHSLALCPLLAGLVSKLPVTMYWKLLNLGLVIEIGPNPVKYLNANIIILNNMSQIYVTNFDTYVPFDFLTDFRKLEELWGLFLLLFTSTVKGLCRCT